ncbi:MAG: tRNA (adenosine(37)-N6)-dimethylallyltransferase MiaA [Rikenellaceae bacterium]|nr:tRNA (adenosine(37)-N6)-dimethylallyltransferase MiaA [Rikenellaceae bacterium]
MNNRLVVIAGATGVGKTETAIAVSKRIDAPIVSCDSRQFYREMTIGTAVPTPEQLAAAEHRFIHSRSVFEPYSCGEYAKEALETISELFRTHNHVILTGGSGLYIDAVTEGFDEIPSDETIREALIAKCRDEGIDSLLRQLRELDPEYYDKVDRCNPQRVIRAIEVCLSTGEPYSKLRKGESHKRDFETIYIMVDRPREELYDRINRRVDAMLSEGLVEEARNLRPHAGLNALATVGYRELFDHFDGKHDMETAVELIKRNTRRYAKRQLTWFRRNPRYEIFSPDDINGIVSYILSAF